MTLHVKRPGGLPRWFMVTVWIATGLAALLGIPWAVYREGVIWGWW